MNARRILMLARSGTGFLFVPLCIVTLVWAASFLSLCIEVGLSEAAARSWVNAALLKGAWFLGGVRVVYRMRRGCL